MRNENKKSPVNAVVRDAELSQLWKFIDKDDKQAIQKWAKVYCSAGKLTELNRVKFTAKQYQLYGIHYAIPIFAAARNKKEQAFIALIEAGVNLLARDAFRETILDVICEVKWLEGLNYLVEKRNTLLLDIKTTYYGENLLILHHIAHNIKNKVYDAQFALKLVHSLLKFEGSQHLINAKLGGKTFLEIVENTKLKKIIESMILERGLILPVSNAQPRSVSKFSFWSFETPFARRLLRHHEPLKTQKQGSSLEFEKSPLLVK